MYQIKKVLLFLIIILSNSETNAQGYQVGSIIQDFSLLDVNGKNVTLSNIKNQKGFIIVFTSNTCPFSKLYEDRLIQLGSKFGKLGYHLIAINANDVEASPDDNLEKMKEKAQDKRYNFPYLYDADQIVTSKFLPAKTPHAFVLALENKNYKVVYSGAIDDNSSDPSSVKINYIESAINELIASRKVSVASTKSVGCTVKWKRSKTRDK